MAQNNTSIMRLMRLHLYDYLEPNGIKKVSNQKIDLIDTLDFVANCLILENKLIFQFSAGLGYTLAQMCIAYIEKKFELVLKKNITSPFIDIPNKLAAFGVISIDEIDNGLSEILIKVEQRSRLAYDYFFRLFEYSLGYIALHELGHYLNGHHSYFKDISPTYKYYITERQIAEFQADVFATQFLLNNNVHYPHNGKPVSNPTFKEIGDSDWEACVVHSIFITFVLLEKIGTNQKGRVHPPSIYRIINASKHIIGVDIWQKADYVTEKFELLLNDFIPYSELFINTTSTWKDSVYQFWGNSNNAVIHQGSDVFEVIKLQMATKEFRLKIKDYAARSIDNFCHYNDFLKLIIISGNHIPWNHINTEEFYFISLKLIDFNNQKIKKYIRSSNDNNLIQILKHMEKNNKVEEESIDHLINKINNLINLDIKDVYEVLGSEILQSKVIQIKEKPNRTTKIRIGKFWFKKFEEVIKEKLNTSKAIKYFLLNPKETDHQIIFTISDLIENMCVGCSSVVVSVLLLKRNILYPAESGLRKARII